jgi:Ni/Co efflux regulator RcnB
MSSKRWLRAGATTILSLALSTTISFAQEEHGHGHEKHDRDDRDDEHGHGRDHDSGRGHDHERHDRDRYSDHDRDAARGWYHDHYSHLPPGLAKRDRLPPGLERQLVVRGFLPVDLRRQMRPCPRELEVMLPPPPPNYAHFVIGGNLVLVNRANFQIADVFHFDIH